MNAAHIFNKAGTFNFVNFKISADAIIIISVAKDISIPAFLPLGSNVISITFSPA